MSSAAETGTGLTLNGTSGSARVDAIRSWLWAGFFVMAAVGVAASHAAGFSVTGHSAILLIACTVAGAILWRVDPARFGRRARLVRLFECFFLYAVIGALGALFSYLALRFSHGFTDRLLADADQALGFDWPAIEAAVADRPWLHFMLYRGYMLFKWMPLFIFGALHLTGRTDRIYDFLLAAALSLIATIAVFYFFPARAAFHFFLDPASGLPGHAVYYELAILELRRGLPMTIDPLHLAGVITFPSFHATMAILFAWAAWPVRPLRPLFVTINLLMWIGAVPIGGHYVVDLIGGSIIAVAAIWAAGRLAPQLR